MNESFSPFFEPQEDNVITPIHFATEPEGDTMTYNITCTCFPVMIIECQRSIKKNFNIFSQDQATQILADQRCNLLIRENEKLTTQLKSVREALARCQGKNKNLKRNGEAKKK